MDLNSVIFLVISTVFTVKQGVCKQYGIYIKRPAHLSIVERLGRF